MKKVIHLLEDMKKELEHEAETEAEIFDKALCACETGEKDLQKVIEDATAQIAAATAKIETESAGKAQLVKELAVHKGRRSQLRRHSQKVQRFGRPRTRNLWKMKLRLPTASISWTWRSLLWRKAIVGLLLYR